MKRKVFTLCALLMSTFGITQNLDYVYQQGADASDITSVTTFDSEGNQYIAGNFSGTVDFDPGVDDFELTSNGGTDVFILKLDAAQNFVWAFSFGGVNSDIVAAIALDADDNIHLTGQFSGTVDFDPGVGDFSLTWGNGSAYVAKYNSDGEFSWAVNFSSGGGVTGRGIGVDELGNVYSTGNFSETADFDPGVGSAPLTNLGTFTGDTYVSKLNSDGEFVWVKGFHTHGDSRPFDMAVNAAGDSHITGSFTFICDFDPNGGVVNRTTPSTSIGKSFIVKLNSDGELVWVNDFGDNVNTSSGSGVAIDETGNIYATGSFGGTVDFDLGVDIDNHTSNGLGDIYVVKMDGDGNWIWATSNGGTQNDSGIKIDTDELGNVYTAGYFNLDVDFDPGVETFNLTSVGGIDFFAQKLSDAGEFEWAVAMGGSETDFANNVYVTGDNEVHVVGYFAETVDFDPSETELNLTSAGSNDGFFLKLTCESSSNIDVTASCDGYTVPSGDETYFETGIYNDTLDNMFGCDSLITINLTIDDEELPTITCTDIELEADPGTCELNDFTLEVPTHDDNCEVASVENDAPATLALGENTITWTVTDAFENSATCDQVITIIDVEAPELIELDDVEEICEATLDAPVTTDNCAGSITGTTETEFPVTEVGTTEVIWLFDDGNGNTTEVTQNVIISGVDVATTTSAEGITITADNDGASSYQWIDCATDEEIDGATDQSFTVTENGEYAVIITEGECTDTSDCVNITAVGLQSWDKENIAIYPNPAHGQFIVEFGSNGAEELRIFSATGKLVFAKRNLNDNLETINIEGFATGIYQVQILTQSSIYTKQLIIK